MAPLSFSLPLSMAEMKQWRRENSVLYWSFDKEKKTKEKENERKREAKKKSVMTSRTTERRRERLWWVLY